MTEEETLMKSKRQEFRREQAFDFGGFRHDGITAFLLSKPRSAIIVQELDLGQTFNCCVERSLRNFVKLISNLLDVGSGKRENIRLIIRLKRHELDL